MKFDAWRPTPTARRTPWLAWPTGLTRVTLSAPFRSAHKSGAGVPRRAGNPRPGGGVAFSPDGRRLVTGGEGNTVKVWSVQTGRELEPLRGHTGDVCAVAF